MKHLTSIFHHRGVAALLVACSLLTLVIVNRLYLVEARTARAESVVIATGEVLYVPDVRTSRIVGLGYDQAMADLLWIRTLGYFAQHFTSDREYRWLEHFIEQIIELDPKFRKVYHWAGANVLYGRRFTNSNVRLSNRFYKQALDRFPDDYEAAYRLGLNYYIEMNAKDAEEKRVFKEIGLSYLEMAANRPKAPARIRSLVASISGKLGKQQVAMQYLIDLYLQATDERTKLELKARMDALRDELGGDDALLEAAKAFEAKRTRLVPYVPTAMFALMGEPDSAEQPDVDWRTLLPDVNLSGDGPATAPPSAEEIP